MYLIYENFLLHQLPSWLAGSNCIIGSEIYLVGSSFTEMLQLQKITLDSNAELQQDNSIDEIIHGFMRLVFTASKQITDVSQVKLPMNNDLMITWL